MQSWPRRGAGAAIWLLALGLAGQLTVVRADTIATNCGLNCAQNTFYGSGVTALGQSITTPGGGPWTNVAFNFYTTGLEAHAVGTLYTLSQPYFGRATDLSNSTTGFLASAAANGTSYMFNSLLTLQPNQTYYFYMANYADSDLGAWSGSGVGDYAGGAGYYALDISGGTSYRATSLDVLFTLSGDAAPNPGPMPGAGVLSYLVMGLGCLFVWRKPMRARLSLLCAPLHAPRRFPSPPSA